MALPFEHCVRVAVAEAREIILDGAADELDATDLGIAEAVLDGTTRDPDDVERLAQVVALGVDYLSAVGRERAVREHLSPNPENSVRYWYLTAGG
jgi:hypothetical protein